MVEENTEQMLAKEIEVIDMNPTEEEVIEQIKVDSFKIRKDLGSLAKAKQDLQNEVSALQVKKSVTEDELVAGRARISEEINKMGETITKKVAALEVIKQIKMTNIILIVLLIPFIAMQAFIKNINVIVGITDLVFLGAWGWHLIMNKRKMQTLKTRYSL